MPLTNSASWPEVPWSKKWKSYSISFGLATKSKNWTLPLIRNSCCIAECQMGRSALQTCTQSLHCILLLWKFYYPCPCTDDCCGAHYLDWYGNVHFWLSSLWIEDHAVFKWNILLADFYCAHLFKRMFTLERSIFLVFINTTMGYHIFAACVGPTMFMEVSSLMLRNVKRGSIQLMVSLNLTLNSSATSEIDWTAQISKSKVITVLPWFLDWAEYWFYILFFYCITNLTLYTSMP